jgi:two-component system, OmpR family, sensor histidine kinase VicK
MQDYTAEIRDSNRNLILSFPSKSEKLASIPLIADPNRIKQVINNLIDNAIKFTQKGEITIVTEIDNKHDQVIVKVKDMGTGINSDMLPKIFGKFVTRSEKGTGLGLFISKGIIDAHSGRIWAEKNKQGKGSTFSFSFPLSHA